MTNRKLGKYEIIERLGRGGMAEVYRAYHVSLDRYVAIKILHTFLADAPEFKTRFEKEAQSVAKLKHNHIVQVYDFDYEGVDDGYYMVMELVNGPTLKERLAELNAKGARLPLGEVLRIMYEAASALAYAHSQNMIHRDVKPANLMLENGKRVVLTDFGIAKILTGQQYTTTGGMVGTPAYMSPEQGMGETGDERSDIYSLGVILYEMLTGRLPYEAETPVAMILQHVNSPVPSALEINPTLPPEIDHILVRMLSKYPVQRYQTMQDFISDLKRLRSGQLVFSVASEPPILQTQPLPPRSVDTIKFAAPEKPPLEDVETVVVTPLPEAPAQERTLNSPRRWRRLWGCVVSLFILIAGGMFVAQRASVPAIIAAVESSTPTLTSTLTTSPVISESPRPTATATLTVTPTHSQTPTPTYTVTNTNTPTRTPTFTVTPAPVVTDIPSPTVNATETLAFIRTATIAACNFDYAIIENIPRDGQEGGFFRVNTRYERRMTFLNTGTCAWEPNTSLTFLEGEDFDAGPRIFIREVVEAGAEVTLLFAGTLPSKGSLSPLVGRWELRTPGQIVIGAPLVISIMVYDPG